ncbi:MAG: CorA family divalent cation transporter, partial [Rudaea sp.]
MLTIYRTDSPPQHWRAADVVRSAADILWIDLVDPEDTERDKAAKLLGAFLPTRDQISALELSSRLRADDEMLRLNVPAFVRDDHGHGATTPLAFVLTPKLLVCVRYAESAAFDATAKSLDGEDPPKTSVDIFVDLIEAIVNVDADRMEAIAGDLSKLARSVFADTQDHRHQLKSALFQVGAMQREIIQIRSTQLGISRMLTYLCDSEHAWIGKGAHADLKMTHKDVDALAEFDQQLSDRLEFLLDAVL